MLPRKLKELIIDVQLNLNIPYIQIFNSFRRSLTYSSKALRPVSVTRHTVRGFLPTNPFSTAIYPADESLSS